MAAMKKAPKGPVRQHYELATTGTIKHAPKKSSAPKGPSMSKPRGRG
jgi:hypothetical protein